MAFVLLTQNISLTAKHHAVARWAGKSQLLSV